jgi:hypothetical protein
MIEFDFQNCVSIGLAALCLVLAHYLKIEHRRRKLLTRDFERWAPARNWASEKIEGHLFDSYAQLDAMLRMLDTEDEAPLISLVDDVKARLNRADLVVLAMRDGRIASHIAPDGERVFEIRKERAL